MGISPRNVAVFLAPTNPDDSMPDFDTSSLTVHADAPGNEHPPIVMLASRRELPLDLGRVKPRPAFGELLGL